MNLKCICMAMLTISVAVFGYQKAAKLRMSLRWWLQVSAFKTSFEIQHGGDCQAAGFNIASGQSRWVLA